MAQKRHKRGRKPAAETNRGGGQPTMDRTTGQPGATASAEGPSSGLHGASAAQASPAGAPFGGPAPGAFNLGGQAGAGQIGGGAPGLGMNPMQQAAVQQAQERVGLFGEIVWIMLQSPPHKHLFLSDLEWLVLPAIQLGQFRLWRNAGMPVAFASWAYLDERAEARLKENVKKLGPSDWKSGEALWLIDLIAPFGGGDEALKELKAQVFQGKSLKSLQPAADGRMVVVEW